VTEFSVYLGMPNPGARSKLDRAAEERVLLVNILQTQSFSSASKVTVQRA
jgi:hypothetical protein